MVCTLVTVAGPARAGLGDWTGNYLPCERHAEVLKQGPMKIGVRFATVNRNLSQEFARAMDFWASILDMDWRPENSRKCAIQVVDGHKELFPHREVARAQFPSMPSFQGWIAFNPNRSLAPDELFRAAVHELGHVLGLQHSSNASSVMYFLLVEGETFLDAADLAALASRHRLRNAGTGLQSVPVSFERMDTRRAMKTAM